MACEVRRMLNATYTSLHAFLADSSRCERADLHLMAPSTLGWTCIESGLARQHQGYTCTELGQHVRWPRACADTFFCVVDLHAITLPHDPKDLLEATRKSAALYIASGIAPDKASIFVQSHVSAHAELAWLLQCYTPIGQVTSPVNFPCLYFSDASKDKWWILTVQC